MESVSVSGEVGGAGGAYSYEALKRLDQLWSSICSAQDGTCHSMIPILIRKWDNLICLVNYTLTRCQFSGIRVWPFNIKKQSSNFFWDSCKIIISFTLTNKNTCLVNW